MADGENINVNGALADTTGASPRESRSTAPAQTDGWLCRSCACVLRVPYKYPPSPWAYCARGGCAMTPDEQLVAVARLQLAGALTPATAATACTPPPQPAPERPLMTIPEVAAFFGKGSQAVYKMVERAQLPGVTRVGRRLYVRRADLLRSLAEGRVPSPGRSR